jgi:C-8 sterol isomerase
MPTYIFDPDTVHECAMKAIGLPKPAMFDAFGAAMDERYPGVLDPTQPWLYSIAGGAMIQMKLYYASIFEYIMIWGTPIGSEGHSGRHRVGFWDTVIDGEMWYFAEGEFERRVYTPGDRVYVGPGQACGMNFTNGVWAVEYERGPLPTSVPFGLADELLSCLDVQTAAQTLSLYTDLVMHHFGRTLGDAPGPIGPAAKVVTGTIGRAARRVTDWLQPPATLHEMPKDNPRWSELPKQPAPAPRPFPVKRPRPASSTQN